MKENPPLEERIAIIERTCEYLAIRESLAVAFGKIEATEKVMQRLQWEIATIIALNVAMVGMLVGILLRG
jgi:uncharacterized Rmd1/YagE family protein